MQNATLIILALVALSARVSFAEEGLKDVEHQPIQGEPETQAPPLIVARNPLVSLPGMSAPPAALPVPLIQELTNYPNPFDSRKPGPAGQTVITYQLAEDAHVEMEMYDLLGRKVRSWDFPAGQNGGRQGANAMTWDGTDGDGRKVSKGGYIAQIVVETPHTTVTAIRKIGVIY